MVIELPYGRVPYPLLLAGTARVLRAPSLPRPPSVVALLEAALQTPIASRSLEELVRGATRITAIVSDATRHEPRDAMLDAIRRRVDDARLTVAIATGTHGPARNLVLPDTLAAVVDHDGHRGTDLVELGTTPGGTPIRVHRAVVDTDLVIATGCIRPHYFAGFAGGAKAIFPGLGEATAIRINHVLKRHPDARAGNVTTNPCRLDLEAAVAAIGPPIFLLNMVAGPDDDFHAAVAGHVIHAHRVGCATARAWFTVRALPAAHVIASDGLPVTATLYQSAKIAAAVAPLVRAGGTLTLVAECADGIGPLDVVNEAIFRTGILPRLAAGVRLELLSSLSPAEVNSTLLEQASRTLAGDDVIVVPNASQLICEGL